MAFDEQPDGDPHGECAAEIHRLQAEVAAKQKQADTFYEEVGKLRRWISLYSECDCDVSKNKGVIHWFACRYVLGRKALGIDLETKKGKTP